MGREKPVSFDCAGERLFGILHPAESPAAEIGMLLVVGGPQYRVGSHRQFVLLARTLAAAGIPVLRFDYRGMGDSGGEPRDFEAIGDDIRAAIDCMAAEVVGLKRFALWGLCDAASANAFYAPGDPRVIGQVAANPWARTAEGEAQAYIRHYYLERVLSRDFWRKVMSLRFDAVGSLRDFLTKFKRSRSAGSGACAAEDSRPLPVRLREAQVGFDGPVLLLLSGNDLTAKEYLDRVADVDEWQRWMESTRVTLHRLDAADHTFSRAVWRDQVAGWTRDWLLRLARGS